ncbi:DUF1033 family protein [Planococcus versutus]|uniref:DUF1033 domain-containing protein n=1 Tax=Planococcus versutus TaxID=1302659 RepID=A0A1B1S4Z3_9BACL|nr:DUF1033 family protein [Planococcus versutus]ANU28245.1 hypothetical protein I858_014735 [Planococcus versutus]
MHEIIYMKTDYEPWWMFDGWEKSVVSRHEFTSAKEAMGFLETLKQDFSYRFPEHEQRNQAFYCYWNEEEVEYCDKCEEDLQVFHGLIWLVDGKSSTSY